MHNHIYSRNKNNEYHILPVWLEKTEDNIIKMIIIWIIN